MASGFRQVQALANLHSLLPITRAMPEPTHRTASPDFLLHIVSEIQDRRPASILDIGSGATTIWMAHALRHFGIPGKIVSIDHEEQFGEDTARNLKKHGMDDIAEVRIAPLVEVEVRGEKRHWYDPKQLDDVKDCPMVAIDGPPGFLHPLSRYPALPIISSKVSRDGWIFMDDASRPDELEIVELWCREYPEWSSDYIEHEKGTAVLTRRH
ncbi:class I SAM-dependent methyltransferase [Streptomyces sp. NPDC102381]|uniref:class I SAM-dependent methyltransferase n=1 Tax=Streptomyces sp. NPDC102381 TaxID=3366164 RepID=UPI00381BFF9F